MGYREELKEEEQLAADRAEELRNLVGPAAERVSGILAKLSTRPDISHHGPLLSAIERARLEVDRIERLARFVSLSSAETVQLLGETEQILSYLSDGKDTKSDTAVKLGLNGQKLALKYLDLEAMIQGTPTLKENEIRNLLRASEKRSMAQSHALEGRVAALQDELRRATAELADARALAGGPAAIARAREASLIFGATSNSHLREARYWASATVLSVLLTVGVLVGWGYLAPLPADAGLGQAIEHSLLRLTATSMLAWLVYWCAHSYRANRHNAVVNQRRENALRSFDSVAFAARADTVKDSLLSYAAYTIFGAEQTGWEPRGEESRPIPLQMVEGLNGHQRAHAADSVRPVESAPK